MHSSNPMNLAEIFDSVSQFHRAFEISEASAPKADIGPADAQLRHRLLAEENDEYLQAVSDHNLPEIADALGDLLYIWAGTVLKHGLQDKMADVFREIQRSNMSKLGIDGKPLRREDGKVLKGPHYFPPDLQKIVG
ncbi:MAG TPA: nucleoside triphosphate pyrophosphohydrolase family protein [Luteibaculaceae bacterium]|nr:nucleoside triphosphate pyrophosphohydrolase family protein [Luteibaculaceae bacterium]